MLEQLRKAFGMTPEPANQVPTQVEDIIKSSEIKNIPLESYTRDPKKSYTLQGAKDASQLLGNCPQCGGPYTGETQSHCPYCGSQRKAFYVEILNLSRELPTIDKNLATFPLLRPQSLIDEISIGDGNTRGQVQAENIWVGDDCKITFLDGNHIQVGDNFRGGIVIAREGLETGDNYAADLTISGSITIGDNSFARTLLTKALYAGDEFQSDIAVLSPEGSLEIGDGSKIMALHIGPKPNELQIGDNSKIYRLFKAGKGVEVNTGDYVQIIEEATVELTDIGRIAQGLLDEATKKRLSFRSQG